MTMLLTIRIT